MNVDFEKRWGNQVNRQFNSEVVRGSYNRQIGIHPVMCVASDLDPRFKNLVSLEHEADKASLWDSVLILILELKVSEHSNVNVNGGNNVRHERQNDQNIVFHENNNPIMQQGDDIDEFLDELNDDDDGVNIDDGDSINVNIQRDRLREHMN